MKETHTQDSSATGKCPKACWALQHLSAFAITLVEHMNLEAAFS